MDAESLDIAIVGAGPAGLAAAEAALAAGCRVTLFEAKPSVARKFLMAGKSGLNLTKSEPAETFAAAFPPEMRGFIAEFGAQSACRWAEGLGEPVFTGTSGRVFPVAMKASPLLRKWLARLEGAAIRTRWRWTGWEEGALAFDTPDGPRRVRARATILALGGGSWPRLGSDGSWVAALAARGIPVAPLRPANMGFDCGWSDHLSDRFAGHAIKPVALTHAGRRIEGELTLTRTGIESGVVYALSAAIRDALEHGPVTVELDLAPARSLDDIAARLARPRGKASLANHLRRTLRIEGARAALLRECAPEARDPGALAAAIKALPVTVLRPRPLAEAISSAGGVAWSALDEDLMLRSMPGTYIAGEMLDWEAPTGGYLLTGCLATGFHAGRAAARALATEN